MKILSLILNSYRDYHRKFFMNLCWELPYVDHVFIMCKPGEKAHYCEDTNTIYVNSEDRYELLPKKMLLAYEYIMTSGEFEFDYVYKLDNDCYVNPKKFQEMIEIVEREKYNYVGGVAGGGVDKKWHIGKCYDKKLNQTEYQRDFCGNWCGGGFGYLISRKAIEILMKEESKEYILSDIYEDKAIGDMLRKNGILPQHDSDELEGGNGIYSMIPMSEVTSDNHDDFIAIYDIHEQYYHKASKLIGFNIDHFYDKLNEQDVIFNKMDFMTAETIVVDMFRNHKGQHCYCSSKQLKNFELNGWKRSSEKRVDCMVVSDTVIDLSTVKPTTIIANSADLVLKGYSIYHQYHDQTILINDSVKHLLTSRLIRVI